MIRARALGMLVLAGGLGAGVAACEDGTTSVEPETALVSVTPAGGATGVATDEPVVVTFDHAMHDHAGDYAAVHEGDVTGPAVPGTWMMEEGGTVMRFSPDQPWEGGSEYTIHLGGGMLDAEGHEVDLEHHGMELGGMWADGGMMGGMMGGQHPHTGEGWRHENGSYGMMFTFATEATAGATSTALVTVEPAGGATDVDPTAPVVLTFDHAMDPGMTEYAALHEGDINGPEVAGAWTLSEDSTQLMFTQAEPLNGGTQYTIHLGGGMMDADGNPVDMATNGAHMGGEWATGSMMGGGMHAGQHEHMGEGWDHPENGSHGMIFTFTTAE